MTRRSISLSVASAVAVALGLAALPFASDAMAGGKPAAPPAKAVPPTPAKATSLEELDAQCDKAEVDAHKEMRRKRFEAFVAYVAANPTAKDAEKAAGLAVDLATELEDWAKVIEQADAYVKAQADGPRKADVLLLKARAISHTGAKAPEVKSAFDAGFKAVDLKKSNLQTVFDSYMAYAEWQVDENDVDGAKATYEKLQEVFAGHPAAREVSAGVLSATRAIESIGSEPPSIPEGAKDVEGKPISIADYKGKVVLMDFWGTWCPPCRAEMPNVIAAYKKFHDKGFDIIGVSIPPFNDTPTPEGLKAVKDFTKEKGMPWRQIYEESQTVFGSSGSNGVPYTVLIGKDGKVLRTGLRGEALQSKLEKLLK